MPWPSLTDGSPAFSIWSGGSLVAYGLIFTAEFADFSNASALRREILFAVALGTFFAGRFLWVVLYGGGSRLPRDAPGWERWLSRAVHYAIYVAVLGTVLTGLTIAYVAHSPNAGGLSPQSAILDVHEAFANALIPLIALHLCGAAWHRLARRDGVWEVMMGRLPAWRRPVA